MTAFGVAALQWRLLRLRTSRLLADIGAEEASLRRRLTVDRLWLPG